MSLFLDRLLSAGAAEASLIRQVLSATGGVQQRIAAVAGGAAGQRAGFAMLRLARPRLALPINPITCYPAQGSLLLTRAADVAEVLAREADFSVVYEPRMRKITGGPNFFLGMQDGPEYQQNMQALRRLVRSDDLERLVLPRVREQTAAVLAAAVGRLVLPAQLSAHVPARLVQDYFGLHTAPELELIPWATAMFHYLFSDLPADTWAEAAAMVGAANTRAALDAAVANPAPDTLIGRAVALREAAAADSNAAADAQAFAGDGIRNNLIGIVIGAIPTLSKAACFALDELLRRPEALASAAAAAQAGDVAGVAAHLWEALRFNPPNPLVYRRALADCKLGDTPIAKDTMVLAASLSAMHDEAVVPAPSEFRTDRPWAHYQLWGQGVHLCFGDRINQALLPAMLMPLLAQPGLRRAAGSAGQPDGHFDGHDTPFPRHFVLEWNGA